MYHGCMAVCTAFRIMIFLRILFLSFLLYWGILYLGMLGKGTRLMFVRYIQETGS